MPRVRDWSKLFGFGLVGVGKDTLLRCPLSPLMGAIYLKLLDERAEQAGLAYARFIVADSGGGTLGSQRWSRPRSPLKWRLRARGRPTG
jgi:hypothetical protein